MRINRRGPLTCALLLAASAALSAHHSFSAEFDAGSSSGKDL